MKSELPMLRTSERATFKRCRYKWWWGIVEGLRSKTRRPSPHLMFGNLVHDSLEQFYKPGRKRGPRPVVTFKKLYVERGGFAMNEFDENDNKTKRDAGELGVDMLENYYEEYGDDEDIHIIAPEMPFRILLEDVGGQPFWYVGRFDALGIWLPTDSYFMFEHKTGSERKKNHLDLDEQANSYWAFGPEYVRTLIEEGLLKARGEVEMEMILYNFLAKKMRDGRPQDADGMYLNKNGTVSKRQPTQPLLDRIPVYRDIESRKRVIMRIRQEAYENRLVREGKLPKYKNPTDDCSWDCPFVDMCELHETGSDWRSYRNQMFVPSDGYAEYAEDLGVKSPMDFMEVG